MKATNTAYNFSDSLSRIDEILNAPNTNYEERDTIPTTGLTYNNGYYVNCTAIFVDICDSSDMTDAQKRPVLAKIYRSFISEMVAMFNGFAECREISINGDCVWAVFDTPYKHDVDSAFYAACKANALIEVLNYKLKKKGYITYNANIGMDYGRALMIQAGYKGSAIKDIIWMGDVVNSACHLCSEERYYWDKRILIGSSVYQNLNNDNKKLCDIFDASRDIYISDAVNTEIYNWLEGK